LLCRSIQDKNGNCASANQNIRKVNAALYIASIEPPAFFGPEKPLDNREHYALHNNLLSGSELKTMSAEKISWAAAATNTQAQYLAFYYFVRTRTSFKLCLFFTVHVADLVIWTDLNRSCCAACC
jgi:hypothetical protein